MVNKEHIRTVAKLISMFLFGASALYLILVTNKPILESMVCSIIMLVTGLLAVCGVFIEQPKSDKN